MIYRASLFCILTLCVTTLKAVEISHVYHRPPLFEPAKNQKVQVHFTLSENADVQLNIYDDRDLLIQQLNKKSLKTGEHYISWNGKDHTGEIVPAEAYRYTLYAIGADDKIIEHDLSDLTGGELVSIENIHWDSVNKQFEYVLKKSARVMIRVGIKNNGPLLANVRNWVPRVAGQQKEYWNGKDASNVLDLTKHPKMQIDIQAYTLSHNTILVGPKKHVVRYIEKTPKLTLRNKKQIKKKRMVMASQQKPEERGDYLAKLILPDHLPKTKNNISIVNGEIAVLLTVEEKNKRVALNQRAEPVFFVDGEFYYENEVGFLPMTWILDTSKLNEGEHYLTANIRGYEGNFGLATTKIFVKRKINN